MVPALRRLKRRALVTSERGLRRWERLPARHRQMATVGGAVVLLVMVGLLAFSCAPKPPKPAPTPIYTPILFEDLPGWQSDRVAEIRRALDRTCERVETLPPDRPMAANPVEALRPLAGRAAAWQHVCRRLERLAPGHGASLRAFLERSFQAYALTSSDAAAKGLFTGYYEAHIRASRSRQGPYQYPVYGVPPDLEMVEGQGRLSGGAPYHDRAAIETGALEGRAPVLFWADDPVDLHILHIQGSGQVTLPDGSMTRIGYAANNGHRFVGVGGLMRENPRYIFFREITGEGPIGAFGVPLTPLRSLAVDPTIVPLGALVWLDTVDPDGRPLQRLMAAQDTGSAIKGINRGDVFWGAGEQAFQQAGRMARPGRLFLLLPRSFGLDPIVL